MIPHTLKGVDMVAYRTFLALGLKDQVRPLFNVSSLDQADENVFEEEEKEYDADPEYHAAIELDHWLCREYNAGYPTLQEFRDQQPKISRIGKDLHPFRFGDYKGNDDRDIVSYDRDAIEKVCGFRFSCNLEATFI